MPLTAHPDAGAVALVGIGCRFPGGVTDARSFWALLSEGRDAIGDIPPNRIDLQRFFDPRPATPGRMVSRRGGFLDAIEDFDAAFFGISPREAERLDPQQRLLLETAWEALEDAGADAARLEGSRTGVYVGQWVSDFESRLFADPDRIDFLMTTGSGRYAASGRLSHALGLRGPSLTLDTACSSSLVAVHLAVRALRQGDCTLALAGGVNLILQPHISVAYSQSRMMAPDGRCKFGDASGDGYVRSEGAGIVVLKPLPAAQADGDRIYAVIRGSAVNNDGRSSGVLGRPSRTGHEELLRSAYADAGIAPARVGYVEAHGTGTRAGDPVEIGALGAVLGEGRADGVPCLIGSVKTNIGHTESAAGVAGLVKAALALHAGIVPASLHFVEPNPNVAWAELPLRIPTSASAWPAIDGPRIAGVNSFGISGTNAHVVLEAAPAPAPHADSPAVPPRPALLALSARSGEALRALAGRHAQRLAGASRRELDEVCWAAATRRSALEHRAAFIADDAATLVAQLEAFAAGEAAPAEASVGDAAAAAPVFVAPGQGGQWLGMARALLQHEPVFRAALRACDAAALPHLELSLVEQLGLAPEAPGYRLDRIELIQPTLVALAISYARWLESLGIVPGALVGHSMGEVAAAHLAGVIDLAQAMHIVCRRSALMARTRGQGGMAMVGLPLRETQRRLAGREDRLAVAASNGPAACVVSGAHAALGELMGELAAEGVFCRAVKVDVASHSPQMDAPAEALAAELAGLQPHAAARPIQSTVLAREARGAEFDAAYWGRNLRLPVRFDSVVGQLLERGARCFVELGPHPLLCGAIRQTAQAADLPVAALACGERDEPEQQALMRVVAQLWASGVALDWSAVLPRGQAHVDLPPYPWQRERHWCDAASQMAAGGAAGPAREPGHPLLECCFEPAGDDAICWETSLAPTRFPYLADHVVRGSVLFPAAGYCEAALAAAAASRGPGGWCLRDVEFHAAWALPASAAPRLQVRLKWSGHATGRFEIHGRNPDDGAEPEPWSRRASGRIERAEPTPIETLAAVPPGDAATVLSGDEAYALLAGAGLDYGPSFRGLRELRLDAPHGSAALELDAATLDPHAARYAAFPPLLDAVLQAVAGALVHATPGDDATPIPTRLGQLTLLHPLPLDERLQLTVQAATGDADLHDRRGRRLAVLRGLVFTRLRQSAGRTLDQMLLAPTWHEAGLPPAAGAIGPVLLVADSEPAARPLADALAAAGITSQLLPAHDLRSPAGAARLQAWADAAGSARGQVVQLTALGCPAPEEGLAWIEPAWQRIGDDTLNLARALAALTGAVRPRVWLITRQAVTVQADDALPALGQAPLWGLGRVWAHEQPGLDVGLVDIDADGLAALPALLRAAPAERQWALRQGRWQVLRVPGASFAPPLPPAAPSFAATIVSAGQPDSLRWQAAYRPPPAPHEVEIEVAHAGLNFMNLMSALGVYPGYEGGQGPLGIECAGRVTRVGAAITTLRPGEAVLGIGHGCLQRHALLQGELVVPAPRGLASDEAAALPIAFLTALYALHSLARLQRGERVLIHSAAGGVGLAALQVAQQAGAEVFATAGTEEKRALLRSLGVAQVFDSRGDFAEAVLAASGGQGVDVVLNSLAGEAIAAGLRCLAPYGRFVELGKRDIHAGSSLSLSPFRASLSYFAVDLDRMLHERPALLGRLLRDLVRDLEAGHWRPLPVRTFPADELVAAFKALMPGTHVGKHVVALEPAPSLLQPAAGLQAALRMDGCHVVSGGLGALGLEVARWLARRGAASVLLIGRSAPSPDVQPLLREIEALGTRVLTAACDVADRAALAAALDRARREGGALRGVFHAAGVLADATLGEMTPATLRAPRDAKVLGAWNLDRLTQHDTLDAFVMFSSVAALFGTPGQGNYAAANAFLDALAQHRRRRGRPGLALALGPVAEVGLAAANALRGSSLARLGFDAIGVADAIAAIDRLIAAAAPQAVCAAFDARRWQAAMGRDGVADIVAPAAGTPRPARDAELPLREALAAAPPGPPRRALMEAAVKAEVGAVLRMAPQRVPSERALKSLGMDSLMALELRNRLEQRSGTALSPTLAWNHPTVLAIAAHVAQRLQLPLDAPPGGEADIEALLAELEGMSDADARAQLDGGAAR